MDSFRVTLTRDNGQGVRPSQLITEVRARSEAEAEAAARKQWMDQSATDTTGYNLDTVEEV